MTLISEIQAKCGAELLAAKEHGQIAAIVSSGRKVVGKREGGIGLIMEALGPTDGAALLDNMTTLSATNPAVKWAMKLVERGELDFGSATTRAMLDSLLPEAQATALKATAEITTPVTVQQIIDAMGA